MKHALLLSTSILFCLLHGNLVSAQTLQLTGPTQYVTIGDLDVSGNQITVEALVKHNGGVDILSKHTDPSNVNYLLRIGTFEITTSAQFYLMSNPYAGSMQANTWYHIAGTYDGSFIRYYVNGCLIIEQPATGNIAQSNLLTAIGNQSTCACEQFFGEIDELRIWNVARTAAQLSANMFSLPTPTTQPGLVAYYDFNGNVTNIQGNPAFNGTWVGTPAYGVQPTSSVISTLGIQSVTPSHLTCYQSNNGGMAITASGTNLSYSLDGTTWQTPNQFSNLAAGNYTAYIRSQEGCVVTSTVTSISQPADIVIQLTPVQNTSCSAPNGTISSNVTGGTGSYSYSWNPGGATTPNLSNLSSGTYTLQVTDQNSCQKSASTTMTSSPPFVATLGNVSNVNCFGANNGSANVSVSGGTTPYTFVWNPASAGTTGTLSNLAPGSYTGTVTDAAGCSQTLSFTITQPPALDLSEVIVSPTCMAQDGQITVNVTGGTGTYNYQWTPAGTSTTNVAANIGGGTYGLIVTDNNNCSVTANYTIVPTGGLGLTVTPPSFSYYAGDSIPLLAETVIDTLVTFEWDFSTNLTCSSCADPIATPDGDEVYTIYAFTPDGCLDSIQVFATLIIPCTDIFIPTIFSPNGDGNNDELIVFGNCIKEMKINIFDRWGEKVFTSSEQSLNWDGYFNGKPASNGAYVYHCSMLLKDGSREEKSGNIQLVR